MATHPLSWTHQDFENVRTELKRRLQAEIAYFRGSLPEHRAIAWDGYIAALLEWGLISPSVHSELLGMLPVSDRVGAFLRPEG